MKALVRYFIPFPLILIVVALCAESEAACRHHHHSYQLSQKPLLNDLNKQHLVITSDLKNSICIDKFTAKNDFNKVFLIWKNKCKDRKIVQTPCCGSGVDLIKQVFKHKTTTIVKPIQPTLKPTNNGHGIGHNITIIKGNQNVFNIHNYITNHHHHHHHHQHNDQNTGNGTENKIDDPKNKTQSPDNRDGIIDVRSSPPKKKAVFTNDVPLSR